MGVMIPYWILAYNVHDYTHKSRSFLRLLMTINLGLSIGLTLILPGFIAYLFVSKLIRFIKIRHENENKQVGTGYNTFSQDDEFLIENISKQTMLTLIEDIVCPLWAYQLVSTDPDWIINSSIVVYIFGLISQPIVYVLPPLCIWDSMQFAQDQYQCMCNKCHKCCFKMCKRWAHQIMTYNGYYQQFDENENQAIDPDTTGQLESRSSQDTTL